MAKKLEKNLHLMSKQGFTLTSFVQNEHKKQYWFVDSSAQNCRILWN